MPTWGMICRTFRAAHLASLRGRPCASRSGRRGRRFLSCVNRTALVGVLLDSGASAARNGAHMAKVKRAKAPKVAKPWDGQVIGDRVTLLVDIAKLGGSWVVCSVNVMGGGGKS